MGVQFVSNLRFFRFRPTHSNIFKSKRDHFALIRLQFWCGFSSGTYDDVRHLVTGMFETCRYESTLLTITSQLLDQDIFSNFLALKVSATKGTRPISMSCAICYKKLRNTVTSSAQTNVDSLR